MIAYTYLTYDAYQDFKQLAMKTETSRFRNLQATKTQPTSSWAHNSSTGTETVVAKKQQTAVSFLNTDMILNEASVPVTARSRLEKGSKTRIEEEHSPNDHLLMNIRVPMSSQNQTNSGVGGPIREIKRRSLAISSLEREQAHRARLTSDLPV